MKKQPASQHSKTQQPGDQTPGGPVPKGHKPAVHHPQGARVTPRDQQGEFLGKILYSPGPIKAALSIVPAAADTAARDQIGIRTGMKVPPLQDVQRREYGKDDGVGQETEVRTVAKALRGSQWLRDRSKRVPDQMEQGVALKSVVGSIELGAEQAKTGVLDALLVNQVFGMFLVNKVRTWLFGQLARPDMPGAAKQSLLADGAPFLVLYNQAQQQHAASQASDAAKSATLSAQLTDAQSQLQLQQALSAVSQGQTVDQSTLLKAAVTQQKQGAAEQSQVRMAAQDLLAARQGNRRDTRR